MFLSIGGNSCFFLDTTPSKNIMLSDNSLLNALSTVLLFSPNASICELLFNMSVIANTNNVNLFFSISSFIASSNSFFLLFIIPFFIFIIHFFLYISYKYKGHYNA